MDKKKIALSFLYIIILSAIFLLIQKGKILFDTSPHISPYLALGFVVIIAHLGGLTAKKIGLPSLTGNLIAGMIFGPHLLGFISISDITSLELINSLALSFIAITAGGELKMAALRRNASIILNITLFHVLLILSVVIGVFYLLLTQTSLLQVKDTKQILGICIFLGVIAVAKSPASTIAIINEYRSKGRFTDVVLGVTMVKDVIVLILFAFSLAVTGGLINHEPISLHFFLELIGHILLSGAAGVLYGFLMILFFKYVAKEIGIFIVLASYLAHDLASLIGLEHMFMCMVAGFVVQNFSKQGSRMIDSIEDTHLPIYVIFFAIAGAGLNFQYFKKTYLIVLIFVIVRVLLVMGATYLGGVVSKAPESVKKYAWTGFVTNAGLTLSMVIVIESTFPEWGSLVKSIGISVIAINQIVGPILFKYGIIKSGEATR